MWTKEQIVAAYLRATEENSGVPPGHKQFDKIVPERAWRGKHFARFSDLASAAGFEPRQKNKRLDDATLLPPIADLARKLGHMPTEDERQMERRQNPNFPSNTTVRDHFLSQDGLVAALCGFCRKNPDYNDILTVLGTSREDVSESPDFARDGFVYLMKRGKYYKIGFTGNVKGRESQLNRPVPESVRHATVHSFKTDDPKGIEAYWHQRFAVKRREGEYFELTSKDVAAFKRRKNFM